MNTTDMDGTGFCALARAREMGCNGGRITLFILASHIYMLVILFLYIPRRQQTRMSSHLQHRQAHGEHHPGDIARYSVPLERSRRQSKNTIKHDAMHCSGSGSRMWSSPGVVCLAEKRFDSPKNRVESIPLQAFQDVKRG